MVINDGIKAVIKGSAFLSLITVGTDGNPHPIIVGKGMVAGDTIIFGIYKMETTQQNLVTNKNVWVVAATKDGGPKGYRLAGTAAVKDKQLIFTPKSADPLL